jgi:large subunit ribosomal protein L7/L12
MTSKSHEKLIEEIGKMSVLELADLVKTLEETFGVSAAVSVSAAAPAAGATAAVAEEKTEYKVTLKDVGAEKIKVIKALRKVVPTLSLSDAKKAAEEVPTVIAEAASKADAAAMKKELEEAGAKVELS